MALRIERIFGNRSVAARSNPPPLGLEDYVQFVFGGHGYTAGVDLSFENLVKRLRSEPVVPAAVAARAFVLSQIEFAWRDNKRGSDTHGQLFDDDRGETAIAELNRPAQMTRPGLLAYAEGHVSYHGTAYFTRRNGFRVLRPDLVDAVIAGDDPESIKVGEGVLVGWAHYARGRNRTPDTYGTDEIAAWSPEPDPVFWWRGQSWVTGVLRDADTDSRITGYVSKFLDNSATPNVIIKPDSRLTPGQIDEFREAYERKSEGVANAGKTLWLGGGSDVTVVGSKIGELAIRELQGGNETRVSVRSRVPAPVLGIREGMQGSALNAGNYGQTRRLWADQWFSPDADMLTATLETIFPPPRERQLGYDPDKVLLLQEDRKDAAEILQAKAGAIRALVDAGYDPDSVERAVRTGNTAVLKHSGLMSVQLLPPGTTGDTPTDPPSQGGDDE